MDKSTRQKYKHIIHWTLKKLNVQRPYPTITLSEDRQKARKGHHTGVNHLDDNTIWIYIGGRNMIDVCRTIIHELCHTRQHQLNMVKDGMSYPGSPIELLADMTAGKYVKWYGKENPEIFEAIKKNNKQI
jgi:hypothetical protein